MGDIGFFIGLMIVFTALGTFNYAEIFEGVAKGTISGTLLTFAGIGLFMGAVGKSSQFPLHIWLPDAMEQLSFLILCIMPYVLGLGF